MTVTAALVKDLRTNTGAGMMDCKSALVEVNGNFEAAVDWLRTKGLATAAKKSGRVDTKGLTAVCVDGIKGAEVEINSETDFVAKNEVFQEIVKEVSALAVDQDNIDSLKAVTTKSDKSVEDEIIANVATIGENLNLRRMQSVSVSDGVIASYIHNAVIDNMGKIAVLVALVSTGDKTNLMFVAKQISMHIAAARPECLNKEAVDPANVQREKDIFTEQSKTSGKPDNIIEKMIEGRIRKFLEEVVLLDQTFVIDGKTKIADAVANLAKEFGTSVELKSYVRFELGEGIEKKEKSFADEVAVVAEG